MLFITLGACASVVKVLYPIQTDPLKSKAGAYALDPEHANIIFAVNHLGFSLHHGRFNAVEGSLSLDINKPEASQVFITVNMDSVDTNNLTLDEMLRAKSMFNTAKFPAATFESSSIKVTGPKSAIVSGYLTIKGIRKNINIDATFIGSGKNPLTNKETIGFSGKATFNRSDFNLKNWLPMVGDEVSLIIEAEFNRA